MKDDDLDEHLPSNSDLIMRDAGARPKRHKPWWRACQDKNEDEEMVSRFETIPISSVTGNPSGTDTLATPSVSNNYLQTFVQRKAAQEDSERKQSKDLNKNQTEIAKKELDTKMANQRKRLQDEQTKRINQQREENNLRARARQIKDQIHFWNMQRGQGQYDDTVIGGSIDQLMRELAQIPLHFQN